MSYKHWNSHYKDEMVSSVLSYNGIPCTWKHSLYVFICWRSCWSESHLHRVTVDQSPGPETFLRLCDQHLLALVNQHLQVLLFLHQEAVVLVLRSSSRQCRQVLRHWVAQRQVNGCLAIRVFHSIDVVPSEKKGLFTILPGLLAISHTIKHSFKFWSCHGIGSGDYADLLWRNNINN